MDTKTLYLPAAENDVVWAAVITGSPWLLLAVWLAAINAVTFLIFGLDKWKARRKMRRASVRRIPEKTLFLLALLGGSVGALLGMLYVYLFSITRRCTSPSAMASRPFSSWRQQQSWQPGSGCADLTEAASAPRPGRSPQRPASRP